jgi:signal peptidase II
MLSDAGGWQRYFFTSLAAGVSVVFVFWLMRMPKNTLVLPAAIALILGGAVGNLIDRVTLGYVVDFIHVYYQQNNFPAFNLADSAITLGTILLLVDTFFLEKKRIQNAEKKHD